MAENPFRAVPAVHEVLSAMAEQDVCGGRSHARLVQVVREELAYLRQRLSRGEAVDGAADVQAVAARAASRLQNALPRLRPVINATGIVLHTNLGRAPLPEAAAKAAYEAGRGYLNLELDLDSGKRSSRQLAVRAALCQLTGAESAAVVNNNAAATLLALRAICQGKEVVISRGQLIEIGGSFRIPEIMSASGAILREVGTTNITRLADYERAIGPATAALLRVHTSNYRIRGFTQSVPLAELVALGKKHGLLVLDDVGSGACVDLLPLGVSNEPDVRESVAAGADLVLFSGDKLLGGPQAGVLVGKAKWIKQIEKDPFMRAVRCDKMTLAALEVTVRLLMNETRVLQDIPVLQMLHVPLRALHERASVLAEKLRQAGRCKVVVRKDKSFVGGGSMPDQAVKSVVLEIEPAECSETDLGQRLRLGSPAIVGRLRAGKLILDLRTVFASQDADLLAALEQALGTTESRNLQTELERDREGEGETPAEPPP
jgi:L-seryl-tRNA(Ser) seleniumtransferase